MGVPSLREKFFHIHAAAKKGADSFRCTRAAGKRILFPSGGMRGKRMLLMKRSGHPSSPPPNGRRGAFSRRNVPRYIPAKLLYESLIKAFILVLDKKLSKLFIAPQARQELMRRLLRQTAAKGRR